MTNDALALLDGAADLLRAVAPSLSGEGRYAVLLSANAVATARRDIAMGRARRPRAPPYPPRSPPSAPARTTTTARFTSGSSSTPRSVPGSPIRARCLTPSTADLEPASR
jgi:hypothetical protein